MGQLNYLSLCGGLVCLFLGLLLFLSGNYTYQSKKTPFECGFDPLSKMREPFSVRFFLLVVLFLIFDLEAALMIPFISLWKNSIIFSGLAFLVFLFVLLGGLFLEWFEGVLNW